MGDIFINRITNTDKEFYKIMGPFISRREIVKELGYNIWDDDNKNWFVAIKNDKVCGFVAAIARNNSIIFCNDYVLPQYRKQGIYEALFAARLYNYKNNIITATVTNASLGCYLANGFSVVGKRGKYYIVKRCQK